MKAGPVVSDNGNFVIDAPFDAEKMKDPYPVCRNFLFYIPGLYSRYSQICCQLLAQIKMLTGVVEVGLFCHMAKAAYFGNQVCPDA